VKGANVPVHHFVAQAFSLVVPSQAPAQVILIHQPPAYQLSSPTSSTAHRTPGPSTHTHIPPLLNSELDTLVQLSSILPNIPPLYPHQPHSHHNQNEVLHRRRGRPRCRSSSRSVDLASMHCKSTSLAESMRQC